MTEKLGEGLEPRSEFERVWESFLKLERVEQHPLTVDLGGKEARERGYLIYMARLRNAGVLAEILPFRQQLSRFSCLRTVTLDRLHLSVKDVGYLVSRPEGPDDVGEEALPEIIERSRKFFCSQGKFAIRLGKVNAFPDTVFVEAEDLGVIRNLQAGFAESAPSICFSRRERGLFLPHVSLAHFVNNEDVHELKEALRRERENHECYGELLVEKIELVKINESRIPSYETVETFSLG